MGICAGCGNDYDKSFEVAAEMGRTELVDRA